MFDRSAEGALMAAHDRWKELEELFDAARELPPQERESLLRARALDLALRHELDDLLRAHDALESSAEDTFLGSIDSLRASALLDVAPMDTSHSAALAPGDTVGHYRIVRPIGRGGMGVIYRASDPRLNRPVALKLLPAHLSVDSSARRRFEEEARAASLLDHPNIATVYEVDETADGRLFIAMAYYEGETLREKLARGPLAASDAVMLAAQVASGLKAAHAAGLVHRDIKPGNVIVTAQGVAKILDFGIARIATDEITHDGTTAGTIAYMSPEQTHGAAPHPSTDVWSFGVMLYEMLAGVRPFRGDRDEIVLLAIRNDEPEPIDRRRAGATPAELIRIVQRCLRKNPAERYPDAGGVLADLRMLPECRLAADSFDSTSGIRTRAGPAVRPPRWRAWRYMVVAASVVAVVAILGAAAFRIRKERTAASATAPVSPSIAVLPFENQLDVSDDDHVPDGLADDIRTALGAIPGLKVAARTSTSALYTSGLDVNAIAGRLGVATILQGSVRGDTARLRISARLVRARDKAVLWSRVYDVPMREVFTVQEQIARSMAQVLDVRLTSRSEESLLVGRPTADLEAYDLYLRGRHVRTRATRERLEQALAYFREATERDPGFASAYSGIAETYVNLANFGYVTPTEGFGNANIAAERALELNPRLGEAYVSHAYVLTSLGAFDRAEAGFRRAIDLNPNSPLAHHYYSLLLQMLDRTDEALEQNRRARELDPLFGPSATDYGIILCQRGELTAADTALDRALSLEPKFALTLYWLGAVRAAEGSYAAAASLLGRAARTSPDYPGVPGALAYVASRAGSSHAADSIVAQLRSRATDDRGRVNLAFASAALGRRDEAFALLQGVHWDVPSVIGLRADPLLRSLRSDARYEAFTRALAQATRGTVAEGRR
jgi:serine/threonine-protein kinase